MTFHPPDYQTWNAMPDSDQKWMIAAIVFWLRCGDNGPWPVDVPIEEIRDGLIRNLQH